MKIFLISKNLHSDVMDFPLQQMYSCDVVGKGVCIARMSVIVQIMKASVAILIDLNFLPY